MGIHKVARVRDEDAKPVKMARTVLIEREPIPTRDIRTWWNPPDRVQVDQSGESSRTQQQFKEEVDINNIMKRADRRQVIEHANRFQAVYGTHTGDDLQDALQIVQDANERFDSLPNSLKDKFNGSIPAYLDFVHDPANRDEMIELGMFVVDPADELPTPVPTPVARNAEAPAEEKPAAAEADQKAD